MIKFPPDSSDAQSPTIRADLAVRRRSAPRLAIAALLAALLGAVLAGVIGWRFYFADLPRLPAKEALWSVNRAPGMTFLDRNGLVIASRGPKHGARVTLNQLPPYVVHAFLAAEDRRYYRHGPVDLRGVARSLRANLDAGGVVQGGSTLTQQLAKTIFLRPDQTLKRKLQEAVLAWRLERMIGKDAVLELYLNRVFFGAGAYGLDAAARNYFGKPASRLTLAEAALLAALPKAPSRLAPTRDLPGALARSRRVMGQMRAEGWISAEAERQARAAPPRLAPPAAAEGDFAYALDQAAVQAQQLAGAQAPDLVVQLTIDPELQLKAADTVRTVMRRQGAAGGARQAALVALAPDGAIRALVGGLDHTSSPFDRAAQARRQPGSAFKPFVFAAAVERGVGPLDVRDDRPVRLGRWTPENYGGGYRGRVTIQEALARSINTVAVRLTQEVQPRRVAELARRFGLSSIPAEPGPSIGLGAYEVSLLELTGGYQVFQSSGRLYPPYLVQAISTAGGRQLYRRVPSSALQVYDEGRARTMTQMMRGVIDHGTGRRAAFGRPAAGKTGTSQNWRDAWFVGFTPDWVAGVWVGNDDNRPMRKVTGGEVPALIWRRFMAAAHEGLPVRPFEGAPPAAPADPVDLEDASDEEPVYRDDDRGGGERQDGFYDDLSRAFGEDGEPPNDTGPYR